MLFMETSPIACTASFGDFYVYKTQKPFKNYEKKHIRT